MRRDSLVEREQPMEPPGGAELPSGPQDSPSGVDAEAVRLRKRAQLRNAILAFQQQRRADAEQAARASANPDERAPRRPAAARKLAGRAAPHFSLAELYRRGGRLHSALVEYRQAVQYEPENPFYRCKLGDCYASAGLLPHAIEELETARDLAPGNGFYRFWLGELYSRAGRIHDAIDEMKQATHYSPSDAYYNVRLGILYLQASYAREAAEVFRQAVDLDPDNASYHSLLGDAYVHLGFERQALVHYRSAGRLDPYDSAYVDRVRRLTTSSPPKLTS